MSCQRVSAETKQQKRDEGGCTALFLMGLFLNSLSTTQGKIAMDGNFSHIAPWTALYDDPDGCESLLRLFRKSPIKNNAVNPPSSLFCVRSSISFEKTVSPLQPLSRNILKPFPKYLTGIGNNGKGIFINLLYSLFKLCRLMLFYYA